jgi:hypothetical protein
LKDSIYSRPRLQIIFASFPPRPDGADRQMFRPFPANTIRE